MLRICFPSQRHAGNHVAASVVTVCAGSDQLQYARQKCVARALFHVDTCIFPRDKLIPHFLKLPLQSVIYPFNQQTANASREPHVLFNLI